MFSPKNKNPLASFDALSGLAQELDAPLQSLVKSTQKLLDEYKSRDFEYLSYNDFKKIFSNLNQINTQLRHCCQTTGRMLSLNAGKGQISPACPINEMIVEIIDLLDQQLASARIKIVTRLSDDLPMVGMGKVEVHQVIHNVLINAIQSMPAGGRIKIRTGLDKSKKMIVVFIEDEGVGITPEHLSKVFEPFFTTKERGIEKNSGFGLSIVYSVLNAIGGNIQIQSSLRKGTVVRLDLPVFNSQS